MDCIAMLTRFLFGGLKYRLALSLSPSVPRSLSLSLSVTSLSLRKHQSDIKDAHDLNRCAVTVVLLLLPTLRSELVAISAAALML